MFSGKCFGKAVFHDVIIIIEHRGIVRNPVVLVQTGDFSVVYTENFVVGKIKQVIPYFWFPDFFSISIMFDFYCFSLYQFL